MKNHVENRIQPNRALRAKYEEIVAIVTANPGISLGQIRQVYYEKGVPHSDRLAGMVTQLCYDNRIKYQEVNCYVPVEPICTK